MNEVVKDALGFLYHDYINKSDTGWSSLQEVAKKHGMDSNELGKYLLKNNLVKNHRLGVEGFSCTISIEGIRHIAPEYFDEHASKILQVLGIGGTHDLMEVLDFPSNRYASAREIADYLKAQDLIEILYAGGSGQIKLTTKGQFWYEENKAMFI